MVDETCTVHREDLLLPVPKDDGGSGTPGGGSLGCAASVWLHLPPRRTPHAEDLHRQAGL
ncbi:hypothetical protein E2C01_028750 [Portunus trituberculatus]|uniref:Uncharacterized protein n=1 Tax=Portunus trituberculatus TaxID=210409 RepID=A0A5B7EPV6_PORTR|nr:hypothetical protein [Portunus trituberculatus]